MLCWGQPTHDLHEPQAYTAEDDQGVEQLNQSHKANGARGRREDSFQPRLLDLPIGLIRGRGYVCWCGLLLWTLVVGPKPMSYTFSPCHLSMTVPRIFRFITMNCFVSRRRQNSHLVFCYLSITFKMGSVQRTGPRTSGIWRKLGESAASTRCAIPPQLIHRETSEVRPS